jgi:hypothetical protein
VLCAFLAGVGMLLLKIGFASCVRGASGDGGGGGGGGGLAAFASALLGGLDPWTDMGQSLAATPLLQFACCLALALVLARLQQRGVSARRGMLPLMAVATGAFYVALLGVHGYGQRHHGGGGGGGGGGAAVPVNATAAGAGAGFGAGAGAGAGAGQGGGAGGDGFAGTFAGTFDVAVRSEWLFRGEDLKSHFFLWSDLLASGDSSGSGGGVHWHVVSASATTSRAALSRLSHGSLTALSRLSHGSPTALSRLSHGSLTAL